MKSRSFLPYMLAILLELLPSLLLNAQSRKAILLDDSIPPGKNFEKALFRLWIPGGISKVEGVLVLVPGSNGDGRNMALDTSWQGWARQHRFALLACMFTDRAGAEPAIERYVEVSQGSGQALLDALSRASEKSQHPELHNSPLLFWGISAG